MKRTAGDRDRIDTPISISRTPLAGPRRTLPCTVEQLFWVLVILLAYVLIQLLGRCPFDEPASGPALGIRARIIDGCYVF